MHFVRSLGIAALLVAGLSWTAASAAQDGAPAPIVARVWFLFLSPPVIGYETGAAPVIFANSTPVGAIRGGTQFYRDLAPGTYQFAVEPYGFPTGQTETVQLPPGSETYLQVFWSPTWQQGYVGGRWRNAYSFFIRRMSPRLAQAYLPTLADTTGR